MDTRAIVCRGFLWGKARQFAMVAVKLTPIAADAMLLGGMAESAQCHCGTEVVSGGLRAISTS
jgi:hypothetical protein